MAPATIASPSNPALLVVHELRDDARLLAWSPVAEAQLYIIHRGASEATLEVYDATQDTSYVDESADPSARMYGVQTWDGHEFSDIITTQATGGNCASIGPGGKFSIRAQNCVQL